MKGPVTRTLEVNGETVSYTIEWRRVSYPRLEFRFGDLRVILPRGMRDETPVVEKNLGWILRKREQFREARERVKAELGGEEGILILGILHRTEPGKPLVLSLDGRSRKFNLGKEGGRRRLKGFLRRFLLEEVHRLAREYSSRWGVEFRRIYLRNQRTRWASCSSSGNLSFNFRLIHLPPRLVRYVVCHEVLHLLERGHGKGFWRRIEEEFPDYREIKRKLVDYGIFIQGNQAWLFTFPRGRLRACASC